MNMSDKVDVLGNPLNVGDYVIYTSNRKGLYTGKISKFTKVLVHIDSYNKEYPVDLLLISKDQYKRFKKHLNDG